MSTLKEQQSSAVGDVKIAETYTAREYLLNAQIGERVTLNNKTHLITSKRWNRDEAGEFAIEILIDQGK